MESSSVCWYGSEDHYARGLDADIWPIGRFHLPLLRLEKSEVDKHVRSNEICLGLAVDVCGEKHLKIVRITAALLLEATPDFLDLRLRLILASQFGIGEQSFPRLGVANKKRDIHHPRLSAAATFEHRNAIAAASIGFDEVDLFASFVIDPKFGDAEVLVANILGLANFLVLVRERFKARQHAAAREGDIAFISGDGAADWEAHWLAEFDDLGAVHLSRVSLLRFALSERHGKGAHLSKAKAAEARRRLQEVTDLLDTLGTRLALFDMARVDLVLAFSLAAKAFLNATAHSLLHADGVHTAEHSVH